MDKREQQRLRKQQKQEAAQRRQVTSATLYRLLLFVGAPLFVALLAYVLLSQGPTYSPVEVAATDHVRGEATSPVTVTVYADFQCPACAQEHLLMSRAWPSIADKARLVFRHYPITSSHRNAWTASLYAEAAGRQGRFWEMHDFLFLNQASWADLADPLLEFDGYAGQLGLDLQRLHADMETDEVVQKVRGDQRGGTQAGVRSTPTVFIAGQLATVGTVSRIVELVEAAYRASGAP